MTVAPPVTVIAIGNPYRRDDGAGGAITRQFVLADFMQAFAFMTQIAIAHSSDRAA